MNGYLTNTDAGAGGREARESAATGAARRAIEAFNSGDQAAVRDTFARDVEFQPSGAIPGYTETVHGIEEFLRFFDDWQSAWKQIEMEIVRIADLGRGWVLVDTMHRGLVEGGVEVERRFFMHARMRDGQVAYYASFGSEREMLEHASLDAWPD